MTKKLLLKKNGKIVQDLTYEMPENGIISVGSDISASICLIDENIAAEQFIIVCEDGKLMLLNRSAGTIVNHQSLSQGALSELHLEDQIKIGEFVLSPDTAENIDNLLNGKKDSEAFETVPAADGQKQIFEENPNIHTTMNDVLENLRSDEKFYFQIEDSLAGKRRVYVEFEEMWLGWTATGVCLVSENPGVIKIPGAQIRKDWSGVVLYPNVQQAVWVNNEVLDQPYRLKNEDHLNLQMANEPRPDNRVSVKFHEPTALLVLDSLLPKELPPPVSINHNGRGKNAAQSGSSTGRGDIQKNPSVKNLNPVKSLFRSDKIFGYFTWSEVLIMAAGTLITAAMIFLVLEWF